MEATASFGRRPPTATEAPVATPPRGVPLTISFTAFAVLFSLHCWFIWFSAHLTPPPRFLALSDPWAYGAVAPGTLGFNSGWAPWWLPLLLCTALGFGSGRLADRAAERRKGKTGFFRLYPSFILTYAGCCVIQGLLLGASVSLAAGGVLKPYRPMIMLLDGALNGGVGVTIFSLVFQTFWLPIGLWTLVTALLTRRSGPRPSH